MSDTGYIRLYRSLLGHPAFRNDGEAMAFAWMVLRASWRPTRVRYKGYDLDLQRGQLSVSVRDFAEAMDRPKGWAERLIGRLKERGMIAIQNGTQVGTQVGTQGGTQGGTAPSVITICNYNEYQAEIEAGETAAGQQERQRQDSGRTQNKEGNKGRKNIDRAPAQPTGVSDHVWADFLLHRKAKKAPLTETAVKAIVREADKAGWSLEDALTETMARGWQGFKAEFVANRHGQGPPGQSSSTPFLDRMMRERQQQ